MKNFSMILAADSKNWIWKNNDLPWKISGDLKYFKKITESTTDLAKLNWVIMWRKTWESIPSKFRPLPNRINCILSKNLEVESNDSKINNYVLYFNNFDHCLEELNSKDNVNNIFLIWGWSLYNQFLDHENLEKIYLTKVEWDFECDTLFDWIPKNFVLESYEDNLEENWIEYWFYVYKKID